MWRKLKIIVIDGFCSKSKLKPITNVSSSFQSNKKIEGIIYKNCHGLEVRPWTKMTKDRNKEAEARQVSIERETTFTHNYYSIGIQNVILPPQQQKTKKFRHLL